MFFRPSNALLLAGAKLKSTYKSLELTTAARFPAVIHHTPTKFYSSITEVAKPVLCMSRIS